MWVPLRVAVVGTKIRICSETKTGDISVMSFFFRPSLYKYMLFAQIERPMLVVLLPLRQSQIPFSHNDTLGRYVLISGSLRIRGSRSRHPEQMKSPSTTKTLVSQFSLLIHNTVSLILALTPSSARRRRRRTRTAIVVVLIIIAPAVVGEDERYAIFTCLHPAE